MKLIVGEKYVPLKKTIFGSLDNSGVWKRAKEIGQPYLFFIGKDKDGDHIFSEILNKENTGDFFNPEDVIPYNENECKLVYGKRYVPIQKTTFGPLSLSNVWKRAQEINQPYLVYLGALNSGEHRFNLNIYHESGDFFNPEDVVPYEDPHQGLVIGKRYIPKSKTSGHVSLRKSIQFEKSCKNGMGYLYYIGLGQDGNDKVIHKFGASLDEPGYDWFSPSDMIPVPDEIDNFNLIDKYTPIKKTKGCNLETSIWATAKQKNQDYLFFRGVEININKELVFIFSDTQYKEGDYMSGDYFNPTDLIPYKKQESNMKKETTVKVDGKFILEVYNDACKVWKTNIERAFPEIFLKDENTIEKAVEKVGSIVYGTSVSIEGDYVKVPIPNANREWSLAALDYVKEFITQYPESYPVHNSLCDGIDLDVKNFIHIKFKNSKKSPELDLKDFYTVDVDFILNGFKEADFCLKKKLEAKFPTLFKLPMQVAVESVGTYVYNPEYKVLTEIIGGYDYVKVPLPTANDTWTFKAFDYVKEFVAKYPNSYPVHRSGSDFNNSNYIYIAFHS